MSLNASLKNRVRRLEMLGSTAEQVDIAERLRRACERRRSLSQAQRAAEDLRNLDDALDLLLASPGGMPTRQDIDDRVERIRWRRAARHVQVMGSLGEPDVQPAAENDLSEPNVRRMWAVSEQRRRRAEARDFLDLIEQARGLYAPRHWPLPAELINLARPRAHQENAHGAA